MALLRKRKLVCFYCGRRSAKVQDGTVRRWQCTECEAVNHLDENGQITDPPAAETQAGLQYSPAVAHASSTKTTSSDEGPFCATCIKNQYLLTTNLADYLPSPTHPDYAKYEASYPAYLAGLEKRYPQVCADCEPRVRERIRAAGYVARTDHLRRMMERTRTSGPQRTWYQCGWRGLIVFLGGLSWWGSILGQSLWHFLGMMTWYPSGPLLDADAKDGIVVHCLRRGLTGYHLDGSCVSETLPLLRSAITFGILSIWWNNQLMKKLRGSGFRLRGLNQYYKLQVVLLAVRILATRIPPDGSAWELELDMSALRGAHAFMIVFLVLSTIISLRTVSVDRGPRISFPETDIPLTASPSTNQSTAKKQTVIPTNQLGLHQSPASTNQYGGSQPFSIDKLAAGFNSSGRQAGTIYQSPTPPPEEGYDDPDAMEWTPTQATFNPSHHVNPADVTASFPVPSFSSFKRLPPAPKAPAAKLRTAAQASIPFFKSHSEEPQSFFKTFTTQTSTERRQEAEKSAGNSMVLSPQQFFPEEDQSTGLESLFDAAFSFRDEPAEIRGTTEEQVRPSSTSSQLSRQTQPSAAPYIEILSIFLRILALFAWKFSASYPFKLGAVGISILSTLAAAISGTVSSYNLCVHLLFPAVLAFILTSEPRIFPKHLINLCGTFIFSLMFVQSVWMISSFRTYNNPSQQHPASTGTRSEQEIPSLTAPTPNPSNSPTTTISSTYPSSLSSHHPPSTSYYTRTGTNNSFSNPSAWSTASSSSSRSTGSSAAAGLPSIFSSSSSTLSNSTGSTRSNKTITPSSSYSPRSRWEIELDGL